jgi:hypothetical protein
LKEIRVDLAVSEETIKVGTYRYKDLEVKRSTPTLLILLSMEGWEKVEACRGYWRA